MDPTKNKQYVEWLCRQYINGMFRLEDRPRVIDELTKFEKIKPRLPQRDINRYTFRTLSDEMDKQYSVELKSNDDDSDVKDAKILYKGPLGQLAVPLTKEASCRLGSGTKWCTTYTDDEENMFNYYNNGGPLYIWKDKSGDKYQFHFASLQFMDARDNPISDNKFKYFRTEHPVLSKLFAKEEEEIGKDAAYAYSYAYDVLHGRFPAGERAIALNNRTMKHYMESILHGDRFPEYEKFLFERNNIPDMIEYEKLLHEPGNIPEIREAILEHGDPVYAYEYARGVYDRRWPEGEPLIASYPATASRYARYVIGGPWPEAEKTISEDPEESVTYARFGIQGPWPEGEPTIATSDNASFDYARFVLYGRFPAGEKAMKSNPEMWKAYLRLMKVWDPEAWQDIVEND